MNAVAAVVGGDLGNFSCFVYVFIEKVLCTSRRSYEQNSKYFSGKDGSAMRVLLAYCVFVSILHRTLGLGCNLQNLAKGRLKNPQDNQNLQTGAHQVCNKKSARIVR